MLSEKPGSQPQRQANARALDRLFLALAMLSVLEFAALILNLISHPFSPSVGGAPYWLRIVAGLIAAPLTVLVGLLIVWRSHGNLVGGFLVLYATGFAGWQFDFDFGSPELSSVTVLVFAIFWFGAAFPSLFYLLLHFPTGVLYPRRFARAFVVLAAIKFAGVILELLELRPGGVLPATSFPVAANPLFVPALSPLYSLIALTIGAQGVLLVGLAVAGVVSILLRYRASAAPVRQQIKWVAWLALILILVLSVYMPIHSGLVASPSVLTTAIETLSYSILMTLPVLSIGAAILRHRLWDIDLIITRTLVYGVLTVVVIGTYVLLVGSLSAMFQTSGNLLLSLLATGLVAVLIQPLRARFQRIVNHFIYGDRDDPYMVLSNLGQRMETTLAPEATLTAIVETIGQALKVPYSAIELKERAGYTTVAEYRSLAYDILSRSKDKWESFPLVYQQETLGHLIVAPRSPGELITPADRRLLKNLAHQVGVAAHAVQLNADLQQVTKDLQRSRESLVLAREDERRRLRRELHDGLAPTLAALALTASNVGDLIPTDPAAAMSLTTELQSEIRSAVADIRRMVYDLRPPVLDQLGLVMAIRERAMQLSVRNSVAKGCGSADGLQVVVEAPDLLPPLPAAVEVAAYRIAVEAVTNVVRHAEAHVCRVRLTLDDALQVEVTDDGIGLPPGHKAGVGLLSMHERSAELGGSYLIEKLNGRGTGTRVCARLPVPRE